MTGNDKSLSPPTVINPSHSFCAMGQKHTEISFQSRFYILLRPSLSHTGSITLSMTGILTLHSLVRWIEPPELVRMWRVNSRNQCIMAGGVFYTYGGSCECLDDVLMIGRSPDCHIIFARSKLCSLSPGKSLDWLNARWAGAYHCQDQQ
jgi:hypothetical protein